VTTLHDTERKETGLSTPTIAASQRAAGAASAPAPGSPAAELASKPGLRMRPQRPMRALAGALLVVASVVAAIALYARIGNRTEVLALSRDVLAGARITDADLEVVSISSDDAIPTVPASQRTSIVGQHARVRLLAGSLLGADSVQPRPIVDPERVLMSVVVPVGLVPVGLREQSRVVLVVSPPSSGADRAAPVLVEATIAAVPRNLAEIAGAADAGQGTVALAVEVPPRYVGVVGEAEAVSVGVLDGSTPFPGDQINPVGDPPITVATDPRAPSIRQPANLDGPTTIPTTTVGAAG
jgi:SAF domain-containing protein